MEPGHSLCEGALQPPLSKPLAAFRRDHMQTVSRRIRPLVLFAFLVVASITATAVPSRDTSPFGVQTILEKVVKFFSSISLFDEQGTVIRIPPG